jgi:manganese/zinc/iron transport system substrate-binding protein
MNTLSKILIAFSLLLLLQACSKQQQERHLQNQKWFEQNEKIKVLSSTAMVNDLVKQIGREKIDTITLIEGELDPHSYQLVKGDDEKLNRAQIIFYSGLGLEHGPSLQKYLQGSSKAFALGDYLLEKYPDHIVYVDHQKDPHVWMDVLLWSKTVPFIVNTLIQHDPNNEIFYRENGNRLSADMEAAHNEIRKILQQVPEKKRFLVSSHDAFNYFTKAYLANDEEIKSDDWRKRVMAPEGLAPDSQLSIYHIKEVIDYLEKNKIHLIFSESNVSQDSIKKIIQAGKERGLKITIACCPLYADAMGGPGSEADSYLKMIKINALNISNQMLLEK